MVKTRAMFLRFVVALVLVGLVGRLSWVQVVKAGEITDRGEAMRLAEKELLPMRGSILDRAGRTLAISVPTRTIVANPKQMGKFEEATAKLAPLLNIPPASLLKMLQDNAKRGYLVLKRGLTLETAMAVEKAMLDAEIEGIATIVESQRAYPQGYTANHVLGYIDKDGKGEYGLEQFYDKELSGTRGYVQAEFTHGDTPIENTIKSLVPSQPGLNLVLTIDADLQQQVEARLDEVVKVNNAERALAIAMDVHTGAILTMAMRPGASPVDRSTWETTKGEIDYRKIVNWSVERLPPGSIFKIITTSAALEERKITPTSTFVDEGFIKIDGWTITNWTHLRPTPPPILSISQLLQQSSNVGLIKVGQTMDKAVYKKYLQGFGLMAPTGIDFSHEQNSNLLEVEKDRAKPLEALANIDWANMYIGQFLEITPIQMLTAVAAVANGGKLVKPHLVSEIRDPSGKVVSAFKPEERRQVISEATAREMRELLIDVVTKGTGSLAVPKGYTVGGKTGTAQKADPKTGGLKDGLYVADFVGFAPAQNPRVAMIIMVDEPKVGQGFGGTTAAPEFQFLLPKVMQALRIEPDSPEAIGQVTAPPKAVNGIVPDVQGLPPVWAQERLIQAGFTPKISGSGVYVAQQTIKPGTALKVGSVVELGLAPRDSGENKVYVPDLTGYSLTEASQLAAELDLTLKPGGSGFVASQDPKPGSIVANRTPLAVQLAPRR